MDELPNEDRRKELLGIIDSYERLIEKIEHVINSHIHRDGNEALFSENHYTILFPECSFGVVVEDDSERLAFKAFLEHLLEKYKEEHQAAKDEFFL